MLSRGKYHKIKCLYFISFILLALPEQKITFKSSKINGFWFHEKISYRVLVFERTVKLTVLVTSKLYCLFLLITHLRTSSLCTKVSPDSLNKIFFTGESIWRNELRRWRTDSCRWGRGYHSNWFNRIKTSVSAVNRARVGVTAHCHTMSTLCHTSSRVSVLNCATITPLKFSII